jgi:SAM-dependent methyltransferase
MGNISGHSSSNLNKYQCKHPLAVNRIAAFSRKLTEMVTRVKHSRILNLGCGEDFDTNYLFKNRLIEFNYSCGLDLNFDSLRLSREVIVDFVFDVVNGDIENLPLRLNSFDLILCLEVLEHLKQPERVVWEMAQQFDGRCLFSVPNEPAYRLTRMLLLRKDIRRFRNHPEHLHNWSRKAFCRLIEKYFVVDKISTSFHWTLILCRANNQEHENPISS